MKAVDLDLSRYFEQLSAKLSLFFQKIKNKDLLCNKI